MCWTIRGRRFRAGISHAPLRDAPLWCPRRGFYCVLAIELAKKRLLQKKKLNSTLAHSSHLTVIRGSFPITNSGEKTLSSARDYSQGDVSAAVIPPTRCVVAESKCAGSTGEACLQVGRGSSCLPCEPKAGSERLETYRMRAAQQPEACLPSGVDQVTCRRHAPHVRAGRFRILEPATRSVVP